MKVGQYPPIDGKDDPAMRSFLKDNYLLFKNGVRCQSFNYGIGALAYYRRVVEYVVEQLLIDLESIGHDTDDRSLLEAIELARNMQRASERLYLLKEHVPVILKPDGMNPLARLYSALSDGLHTGDDEKCLEIANHVRFSMEFLVRTLYSFQKEKSTYLEGISRLT